MGNVAIPLAALIVAVATLVYTGMGLRLKASTGFVDMQEKRIETLEQECASLHADLDECKKGREKLTKENTILMRRVLKLENGNS